MTNLKVTGGPTGINAEFYLDDVDVTKHLNRVMLDLHPSQFRAELTVLFPITDLDIEVMEVILKAWIAAPGSPWQPSSPARVEQWDSLNRRAHSLRQEFLDFLSQETARRQEGD